MKSMRTFLVVLVLAFGAAAQAAPPAETVPPPAAPDSLDRVVDRFLAREAMLADNLRQFTPIVETYIQNLQPDEELGLVPASDQYFLGRVRIDRGLVEDVYVQQRGLGSKLLSPLTGMFTIRFVPEGFASLVLVDGENFDRRHYDFKYLRREFLGDVRCLVFDVTPKGNFRGAFLGRIWVEDQEYNVVRFNGTHQARGTFSYNFHFDSWRQNLRPGLWLPTYIYNEESDKRYALMRKLRFKSHTRIWGYDPRFGSYTDELTRIVVESPTARDQAESARDYSPLESQRAWQAEAEQNIVDRLERAGLVAPKGDVEKVLDTVVNNLMVTNNLDIQPEVHCRVLLTTPLESLTVGHTIVVSRGLIDVLPDEASLAMVLARELAHIVLGHRIDTKYAFTDRVQFPDQETFKVMRLARNEAEDAAADVKAAELLKNSPYADKLGNAGLFLRTLALRAPQLQALTMPRLGNAVARNGRTAMAALAEAGPQLEMARTDQVSALPLGARIKVDPWSSTIQMLKNKPVAILSARDKMPFEVTPLRPFLRRYESPIKVADAPPAPAAEVAAAADKAGKSQ